MSSSLGLLSVKCIVPSKGIGGVSKAVAGAIGAIAKIATTEAATAGTATFAAPVLVAVGALGFVEGQHVLEKLDEVFSGSDDLYIKVNGIKIWPKKEKFVQVKSDTTVEVKELLQLLEPQTIELYEDDTFGDDLLGKITITSKHDIGIFPYLLASKEEGSIYQVNLQII